MNVPTYCRQEVILRVDDVHLSLGGRSILRGITAEVRDIIRPNLTQGQVVGVLGRTGIGKSQLFRVLAGLQQPTSGRVLVTSEHVPVECGMVGMVAQDYPLFEHRTVLGNVAVAGRQAGLDADEAEHKSENLLCRLGLKERLDAYPAQLSGGQRQRAAIAQQIICSNHFLLMDEPFTGLDPVTVDDVCHLIAEVAQMDELNTIIVSSHILSAAVMVADTLWLLGCDRDATGVPVPGARIQAEMDLIERGLAWHSEIALTPEFGQCVAELRERFYTL